MLRGRCPHVENEFLMLYFKVTGDLVPEMKSRVTSISIGGAHNFLALGARSNNTIAYYSIVDENTPEMKSKVCCILIGREVYATFV